MNVRRFLLVILFATAAAACTTSSRPDLTGMSFSTEPLTGKVMWHDLITEDLDSARTFYGELFGWTFENAQGQRDREYVVARSGNVLVGGMVSIEPATDGSKYSRWLPYVSVADVDEAVSKSIAAGASIAVTARDVDLARVAVIIDPEGAVIGLARSSIGDPDDQTTAPAPGRPVWTELLSNNPATATEFYQALGGYDINTVERRGGEYTFLTNDGKKRAGILKNPADNYEPVWLTYFGVKDPAAAAKRAEELGGTIILAASPELRDGTMAVVTDPTGAILVLQNWSKTGGET